MQAGHNKCLPFYAFATLALALVSCSSDEKNAAMNRDAGSASSDAGGSGQDNPIDLATLSACPQASTFLQTTEWMSCLAGKRISGTEPLNNQSCELRIGADGSFEYLRGGAMALRISTRSSWRSATGLYQNTTQGVGAARAFFGSITPDLAPVDGQSWITSIDLTFIEGLDDTIEVKYFDVARVRQTYTCRVTVL